MSELSSTAPPPATPGSATAVVTPAPGASGDSHPQHRDPSRPGGGKTEATAAAPPAPAISFAASLAGLVEGARIEAVVAGDDGAGHPVIRTATATYIAATAEPLAPPSNLILEITSVDAVIRAVVISRNGEILNPPASIELTLTDVSAPAAAQPPPAPLAPGVELAAVVLDEPRVPLATIAAPSGPPPAPLPPGTTLVLRVLAMAPAGAPAVTMSVPQVADTAVAAPPAPALEVGPPKAVAVPPPQTTASAPGPGLEPARNGSSPASANPPPQPSAAAAADPKSARSAPPTATGAPAAAPATQGVVGLVVGTASGGNALLQTGLGLLSVDVTGRIETGATVGLEILTRATPPPPAAPAPAAVASVALGGLVAPWQSLKPVIDAIGAAAAPAGAAAVANLAPGLGTQFAAQVLFMVAALRGGDVRGWLGAEAVRTLERMGRGNLIARLGEEARELGRFLDEPVVGEWRALAIPLPARWRTATGPDVHAQPLARR